MCRPPGGHVGPPLHVPIEPSEDDMKTRPSRRDFLKAAAGVTAAAPTLLRAQTQAATPLQDVPPNERIHVATIGLGIQGQSDTRTALRVRGVELVAVADVYDGRQTLAKELWGNQV